MKSIRSTTVRNLQRENDIHRHDDTALAYITRSEFSPYSASLRVIIVIIFTNFIGRQSSEAGHLSQSVGMKYLLIRDTVSPILIHLCHILLKTSRSIHMVGEKGGLVSSKRVCPCAVVAIQSAADERSQQASHH